jgi:hypothetical protein
MWAHSFSYIPGDVGTGQANLFCLRHFPLWSSCAHNCELPISGPCVATLPRVDVLHVPTPTYMLTIVSRPRVGCWLGCLPSQKQRAACVAVVLCSSGTIAGNHRLQGSEYLWGCQVRYLLQYCLLAADQQPALLGGSACQLGGGLCFWVGAGFVPCMCTH